MTKHHKEHQHCGCQKVLESQFGVFTDHSLYLFIYPLYIMGHTVTLARPIF